MFSRLSHNLLFSLFGIMVLVMLLLGALFQRELEVSLRQHQENGLAQLAEMVHRSLAATMLQGQGDSAQRLMEELQRMPEVVRLEVIRPDGQRAFQDNRMIEEVNERLMTRRFSPRDDETSYQVLDAGDPMLVRVFSRKEPVTYQRQRLDGQDGLVFLHPLTNRSECQGCHGYSKQVIGAVLVSTVPGQHVPLVESWRRSLVVLFVGAVILVVTLMGIYLRRQVSKRLARISEGMLLVAQGQSKEPLSVSGDDELAELVFSFNLLNEKVIMSTDSDHNQLQSLASSVQQSPNGIALFTKEGQIDYTNSSFSRITGYSAQTATLAFEQGMQLPTPLQSVLAEMLKGHGSIWRQEVQCLRPQGDIYWAALRVTALKDNGGEVHRFICLIEDISERKAIEFELAAKGEELQRKTQELEQQAQQQQAVIKQLAATQNQLVQSEKLASIGQLAAGVAHEINNPVGFINSNLGTLQQYFDDLLRVLAAYQGTDAVLTEHAAAMADEIARIKQDADIDYLSEDIKDLLSESRDGVDRVKKIIQDLKDFSRSDQGELAWSNLHQGIDSTLNVAWNELKYKCQVVKEYGEIPEVNCLAGQVNQVLMNLLVNAAQAIKEKGTITLRTGQAGDRVWVEVEDDGVGISAEHLGRIFDPFFTTKSVGKGTGLGLSLSYGIVKRHGGEIEVTSTLGEGSCFRVWLPVDAAPYAECANDDSDAALAASPLAAIQTPAEEGEDAAVPATAAFSGESAELSQDGQAVTVTTEARPFQPATAAETPVSEAGDLAYDEDAAFEDETVLFAEEDELEALDEPLPGELDDLMSVGLEAEGTGGGVQEGDQKKADHRAGQPDTESVTSQ